MPVVCIAPCRDPFQNLAQTVPSHFTPMHATSAISLYTPTQTTGITTSRHPSITNAISTRSETKPFSMAPNRTTLDIFASAKTFCVHHSANILSHRRYFPFLALNSLDSAEAGAKVWSKIVQNYPEQRIFWEKAVAEIKTALNAGSISANRLVAGEGLPARKAEYETLATKAVEMLIAVTRAESLAVARARAPATLEKKAEVEEMRTAELEAARYAPSGRYSPVSPIDRLDLAMVDWGGPEPSIGRPSPMSPFKLDEEEDEAASAAPYLDLDSSAPLVEVATAERLTPVKARIVDC
jgi:hypothetical protein